MSERARIARALARRAGPRASRSQARARPHRRRPRRASTRESWPGSSPTATPTRGSSRRAKNPLLACLDQVTNPRNLGAVARSAAGAGATGSDRSGARLGAGHRRVCRASAGAVEHLPIAVVTNLARYLEEIKRDDLWIYAADGDGTRRIGRPIYPGASRSSSVPKGRTSARSSAAVRRASRSLSRRGRVAERQRRGRVLLYEARAAERLGRAPGRRSA